MAAKILIVDDEPSVRNVLRRALESRGYSVEVAADGPSGLAKMGENDFGLILCDLRLPGLTGRRFYESVRAAHPDLAKRIVFTTGDSVDPETSTLLEQTNRPCLRKPFGLDRLYTVVAEVVGGGKGPSVAAIPHR